MKSNFEEFERRIQERANRFEGASQDMVIKAALIIDQVLVTSTPVDTGRARANWITSIGAPEFRVVETPGRDAAERQAIAQGREVILKWRLGAGSIFISNNLPYIRRLDEGYSGQAPEGMSNQALQAGSAYVRRARLLRS